MLRPLGIQKALEALLSSEASPADVALVVLSESGSIYAQAHSKSSSSNKDVQDSSTEAGTSAKQQTSSNSDENKHSDGHRFASSSSSKLGEIDVQQRRHQPGLTSFMPVHAGPSSLAGVEYDVNSATYTSDATQPMPIVLTRDERARVLAGTACQAWSEEQARVRRLHVNLTGRFAAGSIPGGPSSIAPSMLSGMSNNASAATSAARQSRTTKTAGAKSVEGSPALFGLTAARPVRGSGGVDDEDTGNVEDEDEEEGTALPVATPGAVLVGQGSPQTAESADEVEQHLAPLMLEGELGATLVLPLYPQDAKTNGFAINSPGHVHASAPMLLVLCVRAPAPHPHDDVNFPLTSTNEERRAQEAALHGTSILSQPQWNALNDCAQSFAEHVGPALSKAFDLQGDILRDEEGGNNVHAAGGGGTAQSVGLGQGAGAGASVDHLHNTGSRSMGGGSVLS